MLVNCFSYCAVELWNVGRTITVGAASHLI